LPELPARKTLRRFQIDNESHRQIPSPDGHENKWLFWGHGIPVAVKNPSLI